MWRQEQTETLSDATSVIIDCSPGVARLRAVIMLKDVELMCKNLMKNYF